MDSSKVSLLLGYGLPFLVLIVTWWLFIIRPQQGQEKKRREMLAAVKKGEKVVTVGGIIGTVSEIKKDAIVVRVDDKVEIQFLKSAISEVRHDKE